MKLDVTPGSPGFVADVVFQKHIKTMELFWPKKKPDTGKKKKKSETTPDKTEEKELEKIQVYSYKGSEMLQDEYNEWYGSLSANEKSDVLGHVKVRLVDAETQKAKNVSSKTK